MAATSLNSSILCQGVNNQTGQDEGQVGVNGNVEYSINGGRTEYNNWELDGGDNMDNGSNSTLNVYPSLDAIAEVRVLTGNYGAQYGRNASGTIEVETKSGTNQFHGLVYEYVRNNVFNARNYFLDSSQPTPGYKKNDFGYNFGGPIIKDKLYFFWSQEWRRDRVPGQVFNQVSSVEREPRWEFHGCLQRSEWRDRLPCRSINRPALPQQHQFPSIRTPPHCWR